MGQDCKFASRQLSWTRKKKLNYFSFKVKLCSVLLASETILYFSKVCCKVCIEHWHFHVECCAPFTNQNTLNNGHYIEAKSLNRDNEISYLAFVKESSHTEKMISHTQASHKRKLSSKERGCLKTKVPETGNGKGKNRSTVKPRLTAASVIRSPRYYGYFFWPPGKNRYTFSC